MKPTGTPAWKLTADCIWNSFRSSGKRHLLLTGSKGSGKTTLLNRLIGDGLPGITTWAQPGQAVWLRENATGHQMPIGLFDPLHPGPENRMAPSFHGFTALGIPALQRCTDGESNWISIDEIGYLELQCPEYCRELLKLFEKKQVIAAVRKQPLPFLQSLLTREDVFVVDLDAPFGNLGCVIMASGLGKRFGGNKLTAPFRGKPLIGWALDATDGVFARRVVVTRQKDVAQLCRERSIPVVIHDLSFRSDTVRLGLEAMADLSGCLFCPGDQPLLRADTVRSLALCAVNSPDAIWQPCCGDRRGAPVLFPRWTFPELISLPEGKGGSFVAKAHPERVKPLAIDEEMELEDVDTPEDLLRLSKKK